jgi:peptidoglycan/LPS O-acetylase OafA/YrhL
VATPSYRRDIDGARAIAVIAVIAFHAKWSLFQGGFVGVDVFFVISGYLMGSIVIKEVSRRDFSLISFYERRVRRIFPALAVMMLFTSIRASTSCRANCKSTERAS